MITYTKGNLFESDAAAYVNTVNTVGVMGKGIALQFKKLFPRNFQVYKKLCDQKGLEVGMLLISKDCNTITGEKTIINFPTKKHWRSPSQYSYIESGLDELVKVISREEIPSIAIPPLGSGNGGLDWKVVKEIIHKKLSKVSGCEIYIYEPSSQIIEVNSQKEIKLTPARAMLLYMLFELVQNGEFVSEFASEKICYFLQRFGAKKHFNLEFFPHHYGPYSGKVKHVLYYMNGSFLTGYAGKDRKPFEELSINMDKRTLVLDYINTSPDLKNILEKTSQFLNGFYSSFSLELLSTIDFIGHSHKNYEKEFIKTELNKWSDRKRTLFSNDKFLEISINHLQNSEITSDPVDTQ